MRLTEAGRARQNKRPPDAKAELKESRWSWVTNVENLTRDQRGRVGEAEAAVPRLGGPARAPGAAAGDLRGRPRLPADDGRRTAAGAHDRSLGLLALEELNRTLENWTGDVANYFVERSSDCRTKGPNRGLRAVHWRACGMSNFAQLRLRVLHAFG